MQTNIDNRIPTIEDVASIENLYRAYHEAKKTKSNKPEVFEFSKDLGMNLQRLSEEILDGTYEPMEPEEFTFRCKATGKERLIRAPRFRDQVIQHAIYGLVYDIFDRGFIFDSYGCRKGKGTLRAVDRAQAFMRACTGNQYYIQMDIKKFYYSIHHKILHASLKRKLGNKNELVNLMMKFCDGQYTGIGLNIGNLLSQLYGLIYMDRLDHFIKRHLKQKKYVRYVDDFVVFGLDAYKEATSIKMKIEAYIKERLSLSFSKWKIKRIKHGINFVGFRIWRRMRLVRKHVIRNFRRLLKKYDMVRISSILEHSRRSSSYRYFIHFLANIDNPVYLNQLHKRIRKDIATYKYLYKV